MNKAEKTVIGDINVFAIDIFSKQSDYKIGTIQFWINGICIGKEEDTYIKPNILALARINNLSRYRFLDFTLKSADDIFTQLSSSEKLNNKILLGFGETFDDYILYPFIFDGNIVFLWKFSQEKIDTTKEKSTNIKCDILKHSDFFSVLNECNELLNLPIKL
jgi:hypothetical protein